MPIKFRYPTDLAAIKFGQNLVWSFDSDIIQVVTGTSPLILNNAANKAIKRLVQYGKCATVDGDIYCNNGKLIAVDDELPRGYRRLTSVSFDGAAYYDTGEKLNSDDIVKLELSGTSTSGQNVFGCYAGTTAGVKNFSLYLYGAGSSSNSYFRYGEQLLRPRYGGGRKIITFGKGGTDGFTNDVSANPEVFVTDSDAQIGMLPNSSSPAFSGNIWGSIEVGTRLEWIPCERQVDSVVCYYEKYTNTVLEPNNGTPVAGEYDDSHLTVLVVEGTPEALTIGNQTATVQNLFEVNGVADEQDIITGVITRKVGVSVSAGVITLSALATPVTEQTTPQPLSTVEGTNTVSWTAEVSGTVKEVEYAYEAPSFEWKTASGAVVSVSDAIAGEVGALTVSINPVQSGSGDPSPDNVRPIFGWTSADVCVTGVNIWNPETSEPGYLSGTGTKSAQSERNEWLSDYIPVPSGATKLTLCANGLTASEQAWFGVGYYNADKTWIKRFASTSASNTVTVTLESNVAYIRVMARAYSYGKAALFAAWGDGVSYEQYVGAPATAVSLGGTYYGGTLDVLTGVLTVDKAIVVYDGSADETWTHYSIASGELFRTSISDRKSGIISTQGNQVKCICDAYHVAANQGTRRVSGTFSGDIKNADFVNDDYSTVDAWKAYLSTNNIQFVYELATPQTVQLTPAQVSTLLGTNVIWASGNGEVSVTYRAEASE